jgi:putative sterol carrier protein
LQAPILPPIAKLAVRHTGDDNPGMAKFLSQQWADDALAALNSSDDVRGATKGVQLCLQQVVTGAPDGEVSYWTKFEDGKVEGAIGSAPDADVTITQDYDTAVALNKGELNAQAAFMQGKLKVTGNMGKLLQNQGAMQAVGPVLAAIPVEY